MSSDHDSHSTSHGDNHGHDSHDSHAHPVANDVIPETSLQDMLLKVLTICTASLLYFMAFSWMGVPLPEAGHESDPEHTHQYGASGHSEEHH